MGKSEIGVSTKSGQEDYWRQAAAEYGAALERLAWAYEPDPDRRRELLQEFHLAFMAQFRKLRCALLAANLDLQGGAQWGHLSRQPKEEERAGLSHARRHRQLTVRRHSRAFWHWSCGCDYLPDDLNRLWKELGANPVQVSPDDLRREAGKLRTRLGMRNCVAGGASLLAIAAYGVYFFVFKTTLERIGSVLAIAGAINVIVQFLKRPARPMPDSAAIECIRFYRAELLRQRDFHLGKGLFSWLLPFLPGPIIWSVGFALAHPKVVPFIKLEMTGFVMLALIVVPLNLRMARRFQRRLDALDASQKQ